MNTTKDAKQMLEK